MTPRSAGIPRSPFAAIALALPLAPALAVAFLATLGLCLAACDKSPADESDHLATPAEAAPAAPPPVAASPAEVRAPEIIIDRSTVAVGSEKVATGEPSLGDKVAAALGGKAGIEGRVVDVVGMRNAKPSQIAAVVGALRIARASGINMKTQARDETTQALPLSFPASLPDCAPAIWIAKDAVIDVWPASGGAVKRVSRGLAGPDVTLGTDAVRAQWSGCGSPSIAIGADDAMTWGLIFDLATSALIAPGSRANSAVLLTKASPGHKLELTPAP
jgi:hypothetical protein